MNEIFHGTTKQNLTIIKPFKRYTPGGEDVADSIPERIYATYEPAFAVAHSFPWSSEDGIDIVVEDEKVVILVPHDKQEVLKQTVCIYALPDKSFECTKEEETGLTYHSVEKIAPISYECFESVQQAMKECGGIVKLV